MENQWTSYHSQQNLSGWWFGCHEFGIFPEILGFDYHPKRRTHIFQRGGYTGPPTRYFLNAKDWPWRWHDAEERDLPTRLGFGSHVGAPCLHAMTPLGVPQASPSRFYPANQSGRCMKMSRWASCHPQMAHISTSMSIWRFPFRHRDCHRGTPSSHPF